MDFELAKKQFGKNANGPTYLAEAEFGFSKVEPELRSLPDGAKVLEVGVGAGILMAQIATKYENLEFIGVEPMGDGFAFDDVFYRLVKSIPNAEILPIGYEDIDQTQKFDLIYLVNVFEHLPDWPDFLEFLMGALAENGRCIILCPNYSFPYESHFRIPIIFNKPITYFFRKKKIAEHEIEYDCDGLWKSLNFCKYRHVSKKAKSVGFNVMNDKSIITEMINRLDTDEEFAKRQGLLRFPIFILQKLRLIPVMLKSRVIENILPYMHLVLTVPRNR